VPSGMGGDFFRLASKSATIFIAGPETQVSHARRRLWIGDEVAAGAVGNVSAVIAFPKRRCLSLAGTSSDSGLYDDMMGRGFTIYLLDDDEDVLEYLQFYFACEGFKVKTYASALDFLSDEEAKEPGCAVAEVRMPGMDGVEFLSHPSVRSLGLPVVLVTAYATVPLAVRAMKLGAADFLEKPFSGEQLLAVVNSSLRRSNSPYGEVHPIPEELAARLASLSQREVDVLRLLLDGQSNKVIARQLGISPRTVEIHRARVMRKTRADSLSHLVQMFLIANDLRPALKAITIEEPGPDSFTFEVA
jgi:two-component system, LuxR family, response regulator FixJ